MPLKDIFLHAGSDDHYRSRLDIAVELAAEHKAHLTAVCVPTLPKELGRTRLLRTGGPRRVARHFIAPSTAASESQTADGRCRERVPPG
jgi:hypothetical protein